MGLSSTAHQHLVSHTTEPCTHTPIHTLSLSRLHPAHARSDLSCRHTTSRSQALPRQGRHASTLAHAPPPTHQTAHTHTRRHALFRCVCAPGMAARIRNQPTLHHPCVERRMAPAASRQPQRQYALRLYSARFKHSSWRPRPPTRPPSRSGKGPRSGVSARPSMQSRPPSYPSTARRRARARSEPTPSGWRPR